MLALPYYIHPRIGASELTKKYQATIHQAIRKKLKLDTGDIIAFEIDNERNLFIYHQNCGRLLKFEASDSKLILLHFRGITHFKTFLKQLT